jgi:hypothetical protein
VPDTVGGFFLAQHVELLIGTDKLVQRATCLDLRGMQLFFK